MPENKMKFTCGETQSYREQLMEIACRKKPELAEAMARMARQMEKLFTPENENVDS